MYDEGYTTMCCEPEYTEKGYYWAGFSILRTVSACMDSIVVKIKIHTDEQIGDKFLVIVDNVHGYENAPFGMKLRKNQYGH